MFTHITYGPSKLIVQNRILTAGIIEINAVASYIAHG